MSAKTEQERIRRALSGLHASGDTITEVFKKMANMEKTAETKTGRTGRRIAVAALAAALCLAVSVTALAYSGVIKSWNSWSRSAPDYRSFPTAQLAVEDGGYAPALLESFENGYVFKDGNLVHNELQDDGGATVEAYESFSFDYEKDGDVVIFGMDRFDSEMDFDGDIAAAVDGIDIRYGSYNNRVVAPDYEPTPEELAAEAAGELVFSWGVDLPGIQVVQGVSWQDGDMHYSLIQINGALTQDELVEMAKEVIANS